MLRMVSLTTKLEQFARAFVWEKGTWRLEKDASIVRTIANFYTEKFPRFYGIGITGTSDSPEFEIYAEPNLPAVEITPIIKKYLPDVKIKLIRCKGFVPYQSLSVGDSVKHVNSPGYGTLGGFVQDLFSPYILAISNNHVFANLNRAQRDDALVNLTSNTIFGGLLRFVRLIQPPGVNEVDAAVGWIYEGLNLIWRPRKPIRSGVPRRGMQVYKYGARTGYTEGTIVATSVAAQVNYPDLGTLNFRRALRIEGIDGPFSLPGDSGSLVISKSGIMVGLLFAGEATDAYSLANPFRYVED